MERFKTVLLISSLLLNAVFVAFALVLNFTPYLDVPLAAYSHQKNCERDFDQVLAMGDRFPEEQRAQVKQLYATLVCQKDAQTGRPLTEQDFTKLFNQLEKPSP
jgi:hypothetical protein